MTSHGKLAFTLYAEGVASSPQQCRFSFDDKPKDPAYRGLVFENVGKQIANWLAEQYNEKQRLEATSTK